MLIIMFLGLAGLRGEEKSYAFYHNSTDLVLKEGEYHNSSDVLMSNFPQAEFKIITTKEALKQQRTIFDDKPNHLAKLKHHILLQSGSETDEIFSVVFETIKQSKEKQVIIDITHGMRNHPVMASFGATLARVDSQADIKLLFAKELESQKRYEYIFLDKYNDIGLNALLLKGFNNTLSMPSLSYMHPFIQALQSVSNHLHTNAFYALFSQSLPCATEKLKDFTKDYPSLEALISDTTQILNSFKELQNLPSYQQYLAIAKIMFEKGYYLVSVTYGFEALPKYLLEKFEQSGIIKNEARDKSPYDKSQAINQFVLSDISKETIFAYDKACYYRDCFKEEFENLKVILQELKDIRNNLAHINDESVDMDNIKSDLSRLYIGLDDLCVKSDVLKKKDILCLYDLENLAVRVHRYFEKFGIKMSEKNFEKQKGFMLKCKMAKNGADIMLSEENFKQLKASKTAQELISLMCRHKESKYLTKEQGEELEACLKPQAKTQTKSQNLKSQTQLERLANNSSFRVISKTPRSQNGNSQREQK